MNKDKWNSLPRDIQAVFDDVSSTWIDVHADTWDQVDVEGRNYTKSLNNEIITLPDAEQQRWVKAVESVIINFEKAAQDKGLPGDKAVATLKELISACSKKISG